MSQLDKWMVGGKISKLVIVITDKDTGEHVERWQFDVCFFLSPCLKTTSPTSLPLGPNLPAHKVKILQVLETRRRRELGTLRRPYRRKDRSRDPI